MKKDAYRCVAGREAQPSVAIMDSQCVRTTPVGGEHSFDGGKKVYSWKRHILTDTMGTLLKVVAHAANIGERPGAKTLLARAAQWLWTQMEKIMVDEGYAGAEFEAWVTETFGVELDVTHRPLNQKGFIPQPIRWVVERIFAWLGRYRRLSKDYEKLTINSEVWFI